MNMFSRFKPYRKSTGPSVHASGVLRLSNDYSTLWVRGHYNIGVKMKLQKRAFRLYPI